VPRRERAFHQLTPGSPSASRSGLHHDRSLSINEGCRFSSHQDRRVQKAFGIVTGWVAIRLDEVDWDTKIAPLQGGDLVGTRLASETVGSATTTRRHFRPRCQRVSRTRDEFSLLRVCQDQVVQPVGGDPDEFSDAETHCVAKKPERDRHSIFSGG